MAIKLADILTPMLDAATKSLKQDWPKAKDYAKPELKKLAQSLVDITKLAAKGTINKQQAKALFQIHKNTTQMVLLTIEGLGIIAVENAINAALKAAKQTINTAAGIAVI